MSKTVLQSLFLGDLYHLNRFITIVVSQVICYIYRTARVMDAQYSNKERKNWRRGEVRGGGGGM